MPALTAPAAILEFPRPDLMSSVLPAAPGTLSRLDTGANVLFAGCADGRDLVRLARHFPRSRFLGTEPVTRALELTREAVRSASLQNTQAARPESLRQNHLKGIFEFVIRQGGEAAARLNSLPGLLCNGGLLFDVSRTLPSPAAYHDAGLVILRSIRLPDGSACMIAGNWSMAMRG
ncbi:MAG TPA: class I SAM-dependent methyltransferase [Lacunisphaera sp.]